MGLLHYLWSRTAASNASADSNVNWAEGQAPSSVNDSARAMMASLAGYRDDVAGAIVTGGTSTAYTVTSYQVFDTLAHLSGQIIAFTPHTTNGATVTLSVDGLGAKPLRSAPSTDLLAGVLIQGTPYVAVYNNADNAFYLQGFYGNPYNVPLAAGMDYWGGTAPNSAFALPIGQAISRTTYATLFGIIGTVYGAGNGSTTFNLPDKQGRVSAMQDGGTGRLITAFSGNFAGAVGGTDTQTLTLAQLPGGITSAQNGIAVSVNSTNVIPSSSAWANKSDGGGASNVPGTGGTISYLNQTSTGSINVSATSNNTGGLSHPIVQPTICCNYIMRIL